MNSDAQRNLPARITHVIARARIAIYIGLVIVVGYHLWRYDLVQIPPAAVSPLASFPAGTRLIVDVHPGDIAAGDAVLFRSPDGTLLLGRVGAPPPSAPEAVWEACARGAHWVVKEREEAAGDDSVVLGPIEPEAIAGKIVGTVPW